MTPSLELRPHELHRRIALADKAIRERFEELRRGDSAFEEERRALDDGLRSLRVLKSLEYQAAPVMTPTFTEMKEIP